MGKTLCLFISCLLATSCSFTAKKTDKIKSAVITEISDKNGEAQQEKEREQKYNDFKSYFPDIVLGGQGNNDKILIPLEIAHGFFPYLNNDREEDTITKLFAVSKIIDYKGLDLLICDYDYERPDEGTYDNHSYGYRFLLLFKDGQPLTEKDDKDNQLIYTLNHNYYGEGGESAYRSCFDIDTTIVTYSYIAESESATGYATPIILTQEFRSAINEKGDMIPVEVTRYEFSSPFYDREYLMERHKSQSTDEDDSFSIFYPTKENKWLLRTSREDYSLFEPPVNLYFYIEKIDGVIKTVFESCRDDLLVNRYVVEPSDSIEITDKDYTGRSEILKCPVIIKTSSGNLELLPNGKFILTGK